MCGRFTLSTPSSALAGQFGLSALAELAPRYNIAPTQPVPAVRNGPDGRPTYVSLRWGLIPAWARDAAIGARMINARAETVDKKPSFRDSFRRRRCLVLADGYYEWQKTAAGKQPYLIRIAGGGAFAFAALWDRCEQVGGTAIESCTIITTVPTRELRGIHDRMPVILAGADYRRWLDAACTDVEDLRKLLHPYTGGSMLATKVSTWVNNVAHDDPRCIQELT